MIRGLIESYYDIQHFRIETENQLRSASQGVSEQEVKFYKSSILSRLKDIEKDMVSYCNQALKVEPIWKEWLKEVRGIGPVITTCLMGWIGDVERFATISKLWKYCGQSVTPEGRAEKRKKGEKLHYSPHLKALCWKIGESFVKTKGGYRQLYNEFRAEYDEKWKTGDDCGSVTCQKNKNKCYDMHRFMAAKRKTTKVFLAHFWMKAREIKGLPTAPPFIIGRDAHSHLIPIVEK